MALEELIYDLVESKNTDELLLIWKKHEYLTGNYRLIICLDSYKTEIFPETLSSYSSLKNTDLVSYFPSDNLIFMDTENINKMNLDGTVNIPVDYSIMFDTNYASYINKFVTGKLNFELESVYQTIDYLIKNKFNYDYYFYLLENYSKLFTGTTKNFSINRIDHLSFYENLYNLELFKSLDNERYLNNKELVYTISEVEAHFNTNALINKLINNNDIIKQQLFRQKALILFLIGVWQIQFSSNKSAKNKAIQLLNFINEKVGVYFEREFIIAYKYFEKPNSVPMLNNISKGVSYKNLIEKIDNIAWDLLIPRTMEYQMSVYKSNYFYPLVLSHDKKLKDLLYQFEVKGFLYHKNDLEYYPIPKINTMKYLERLGLNENINNFWSNQELRLDVKDKNIEEEFSIINVELNKLENILSSCR